MNSLLFSIILVVAIQFCPISITHASPSLPSPPPPNPPPDFARTIALAMAQGPLQGCFLFEDSNKHGVHSSWHMALVCHWKANGKLSPKTSGVSNIFLLGGPKAI